MAAIIKFGDDSSASDEAVLRREQLAAQIVAVMHAHFSRPSAEEMIQVLHCAEGQLNNVRLAVSPAVLSK